MAYGRDQATRELKKAFEQYARKAEEASERRLRVSMARLRLALLGILVTIVLQAVGLWLHFAD